jgi:hypothetical protein
MVSHPVQGRQLARTCPSSPKDSCAARGRERKSDRGHRVCRMTEIGRRRKTGALVADRAHQPLRCTTSSKGRRFKRVPGLSGRSAG